MALATGTIITHGEEEYEVGEALAEGGFGIAYLAERRKHLFNKKVVIKVPSDEASADLTWAAKFKREARILANIKHRNVVKIIAFLEFADGDTAIVQEYVRDAKDLMTYVQEHPEAAPSLFLQALYALCAFHSECSPAIIHRDMSPSNMLVDGTGLLKVIDFGLAKESPRATRVLTKTGNWYGTAGCMAPEQDSDDFPDVDHRADLFALGRSFASALQNRRPIHANPYLLDEPWKELCTKLSQHDRKDRHETPHDAIVHAMELFAEHGLPIINMDVHIKQMRRSPVPGAWETLSRVYLAGLEEITAGEVRQAAQLSKKAFAESFDVPAFFDKLEASPGIEEYETGHLDFSAADDLGSLYEDLYPYLDDARKLACFKRICKTAIDYHRYDTMRAVRRVYASEQDDVLKAALFEILDEEDPDQVIEGRSVIPRRRSSISIDLEDDEGPSSGDD